MTSRLSADPRMQSDTAGGGQSFRLRFEVSFLLAINFPTMSNTQQVKDTLGAVKVVDHAIIANAQPEGIDSLHATMRMSVKGDAQTIDGGFDSNLNGGWQLEEVGVEVARVDLERGAQFSLISRLRVCECGSTRRRRFPAWPVESWP